jgi:hypothetical protein
MKRRFQFNVLALLCAGCAWAQISLVNVTSCGPGTFPGTTCTIPATGSGHLLVVGWEIGGGGASTSTTISSIQDNSGSTYAEAGAAKSIDTAGASASDVWYANNVAAGTTTITITLSASVPNVGVVIWEFSGVSSTAPLDATAVLNSQSASATPSGASVTTTAAGDAVISLITVANSVSGIASGNAFTNDSLLKDNGWAHLITSSAGTYAAQWNQSPAGTYATTTVAFKAAASTSNTSTPSGPCDLGSFGTVNSQDIQLAVNMALGTTPCTANIEGPNVCTVITVQRVVNASLGQTCITYNSHSATLSWSASVSSNVAGYYVFRSTTSGGPYTQMTPSLVSGMSYTDSTVQAGQTYYYVLTAVTSSGIQSAYSTQVSGTIPTP